MHSEVHWIGYVGILNINWRIGFSVELLEFAYYGGGFRKAVKMFVGHLELVF